MKKQIIAIIVFPLIFLSCGNLSNENKTNKTDNTEQKQSKMIDVNSIWIEDYKTLFIEKYAKSEYDKYVIAKIIDNNKLTKDSTEILKLINSDYFDNFRKSFSKEFTFEINMIAGKSKNEIESYLGKPSKTEKISPSNTPCPCDKYSYLGEMAEIVFIKGKADWITITNYGSNIELGDISSYQSVSNFDDYIYVKVKTK